jgi:hypothetical protein
MIPMNMNGSDHTLIRSSRARIDLGVIPPAAAEGATERSVCRRVELELIGKPSHFLFSSDVVPAGFERETA